MGNLTPLYLSAAAALALLVWGRAGVLDRAFRVGAVSSVDFKTLRLGPKPNQYLVLPEGTGAERPHRASPVFDFSAEELKRRWQAMLARKPPVALLKDEPYGQATYLVRTRLMRYPDLVTVRFYALPEGKSALAVYSRSIYGHSDLGANEARVTDWLEALGAGL